MPAGHVCEHVAYYSRVQRQDLAVAQDAHTVVEDQKHICACHVSQRDIEQLELHHTLHAERFAMPDRQRENLDLCTAWILALCPSGPVTPPVIGFERYHAELIKHLHSKHSKAWIP